MVAQGREFYAAVLANPRLVPHPASIVNLNYLDLAAGVFRERFGRAARW